MDKIGVAQESKKENLGIWLGRLFEIGFNIGILTVMGQKRLPDRFADLYAQHLEHLSLPKLHRALAKRLRLIDEESRQLLEQWVVYFIARGYLGGASFFQEYLQSLTSPSSVKIRYFQCLFANENSFGTFSKDEMEWLGECLAQLSVSPDELSRIKAQYQRKKGEFLQADTLIWLETAEQFRLLVVDLSIFTIQAINDLKELSNIPVLREVLKQEISYLHTKSVFANLNIDTELGDFPFSEGLESFYQAFARQDKENIKLIQAGSYAYSFYRFLEAEKLLPGEADKRKPFFFNTVGYTDRGLSAMMLTEKQMELLRICHHIYQHYDSQKEMQDVEDVVLNSIKDHAATTFEDPRKGKAFLERLLSYDYQNKPVSYFHYSEKVSRYTNTTDKLPTSLAQSLELSEELVERYGLKGSILELRNAHAALITRALNDSTRPLIFLTGNPGIGKTTALVEFLKERMKDNEGFLFLYISPRKQVNLDILEKFKIKNSAEEESLICDDRLWLLNTTSHLIKEYGGGNTVQYLSNRERGSKTIGTVKFIDQREKEKEALLYQAATSHFLQRTSDNTLRLKDSLQRGVMASMSEALRVAINEPLSDYFVATLSIQSLKKTRSGDTIEHLNTIFKGCYREQERRVLPEALQALSRRIKHLFFMLDEITGDSSGVAFLNGVMQLAKRFQLFHPQHGFNSKIIVADASIVNQDVCEQHLQSTNTDRDKIYFRRATDSSALSYTPFSFKKKEAVIINANSFPAPAFTLSYKIFIETLKEHKNMGFQYNRELGKMRLKEVITDILALLQRAESEKSSPSQIIVYMQDKPKLQEMIQAVKERLAENELNFEEKEAYLQIHANLSDEQKKELEPYKDNVKVIFMTSSASRGLSFRRACHLLVVMPSFAIEQNLMEIIQVIYRGRGKRKEEDEKFLTFYLLEQIIYRDSEDEQEKHALLKYYKRAIQKRILNIINLLLILKTSIMTRIRGSGRIGNNEYLMVPVGGKFVSTSGDTFSSRMSNLLKMLKQEQYRYPSDNVLKALDERLSKLLNHSTFILSGLSEKEMITAPYLKLLDSFEECFVTPIRHSLATLLKQEPLAPAYINGSLLIIPLKGHKLHQSTHINLWRQLMPALNPEMLRQMQGMANNTKKYPEELCSAMKQAVELIKELQDVEKSQQLEQDSQRDDLYVAIPLFAMLIPKIEFTRYFTNNSEENNEHSFRKLLSFHVRSLAPADGILPIGTQYDSFPFILFRSESLPELRKKLFTERQLLASSELNILNLLLSSKSSAQKKKVERE